MKFQKVILIAGFIFTFAAPLSARSALAAPATPAYYVNSTADATDLLPGDNICETGKGNGVCTLRAAIMESNAHPGKETIELQAATYFLTLQGSDNTAAAGDLDITGQVSLRGQGTARTIIDGYYYDRVFDIQSGALVQLQNLTIRHGQTTGNGGGIRMNGGLAQIENVIFNGNYAASGGGIYVGGGTLAVVGGTFLYNHADTNLGGGGVFNSGLFEALDTTFNNNQAISGGGLYNQATAILINSTLSANNATLDGGGIYTGNSSNSQTSLSNVTVVYNNADSDKDNTGTGGGIDNYASSKTTLQNSILALNLDATPTTSDNKADDCFGTITSNGYNLIGNKHLCGGFLNGTNGDKVGEPNALLDPKLAALAYNNGVTPSHALLSGSPAIDSGNPNGCQDSNDSPIATDQRVYVRAVDGGSGLARCDMGSFEYNSYPFVDCSSKPAAPTLAKPKNNGKLNQAQVPLDWTDVQCATSYQVLVRQNARNGIRADKKNVTASNYTTKTLASGHVYYWSVKACNTAGCTSSDWFKFTIK